MPRPFADMALRTITLETQRRAVDIPVDAHGRIRRHVTLDARSHEVRASGDSIGFRGRFIPFGQPQWIGSKRYGWWEVNAPGSISKTIREKTTENRDITLNREHSNMQILARTANGTLRLTADDQYGWADADMGAYSYAKDIAIALERRDLTGMSYAFDIIGWEWSIAADGNDQLTIHEMELFDTAIVGMPANVDTDGGLRTDLMSIARAEGWELDTLRRRLADPDPHMIELLRSLAAEPKTTPPARRTDVDDLAHQLAALVLGPED